jgi:aspartate/methionine/tyrosine aminotransferase
MQWAKIFARVKYNLAVSGVPNYPLSALPVRIEDLEITGDSYYGYEPLQQVIAQKHSVNASQVFFTLGTSMANHIAMAVTTQPGDDILIEQPTYELLLATARYLEANVNRFPRHYDNGFQINPDDVRKSITPKTKLIALTNLHNPSSAYTDEKTLGEIGSIAERIGAQVLVDEVYLDSAFDLNPRSSARLGNNFIVTNSLTKVYGLSGIRCGWVIAQPELTQKMWHLNDLFYVNHVHLAERLSLIAFQNLDEIKAWSCNILDQNHKLLNDFLNSRDDLEAYRPGFGTVVFPRLKNGKVDELSEILINKYETAIVPGKYFEMPNYFRIGLSCKPDIFQAGIENIDKALNDLTHS